MKALVRTFDFFWVYQNTSSVFWKFVLEENNKNKKICKHGSFYNINALQLRNSCCAALHSFHLQDDQFVTARTLRYAMSH